MIGFIDDHRGAYGVEPICKVLPIAPSTYHEHVARRTDPGKPSARAKRDLELKPQIERVFGARTSRSMARAKSGGRCCARGSTSPAARSNA
jgi:hypothetical protein